MREAANIMENNPILQMGNVVQNDLPISKRKAEQTEQTVFNMRHAVFLSDTVDEKLAKAFLIQARDPAFKGHYETHIQKTALRLIRLRLHDVTYRSLVPLHEIAIWPKKSTTPMGVTPEYSLLEIAEIIMKLYAPEAAPQTKAIDQRCREAPFAYNMGHQLLEETHLLAYIDLVENHYLGQECSPEQSDKLAN